MVAKAAGAAGPAYIEAALRVLKKSHPDMRAVIQRHGRPQLQRSRNHFQSLLRAIVYQQLNGRAASTIYGRFRDLFPGGAHPSPAQVLAVPERGLRAVGLSAAKASYVRDLAAHFDRGELVAARFARMTDQALIQHLTRVKGVGVWSVHMFLMFGLNRPDVLPVGDYGVRSGMQIFFGLPELPRPAHMEELAAPWAPYRSIGSWYMWRVVEAARADAGGGPPPPRQG